MPEPHRLPLTLAQQGLWIGQQLAPANPAYNTAEYVEIDGPVDPEAFAAALRRTVTECEAVNVRFGTDGDRPYQLVEPVVDWPLPVLDLRATDDPDAAARAWMLADLDLVVDLAEGPVFGHALLRVADGRWLWYHRVHHIGLDGYGLALFARRVAEVYTALLAGQSVEPSPFAPLGAVLAEEAQYVGGPKQDADRAYWLDRFADRRAPVGLADPSAFASGQAIRVVGDLDPDVVRRVRVIAADTATTWPDVLVGAVAGYLRRMTGADEVVLGLPVMNRLGTAAVRVPCTVLNVVPLRVPVDADAGLGELARRVSAEIRASRPHHRYRYEDLQRDLSLLGGRRRLFGPAVNVMPFDYGLRFAGHPARVHNMSAGPVEDLSVAVYDRADGFGLRVILGANPDRYTVDELRRHQEGLLATLAVASAEPGLAVARACPAEPDAVLDGGPLNGPARPAAEQIAEHARSRPRAVAVEHEGRTLTYQELVAHADALARTLRSRGIGPGDLVAMVYPHGIDAVVAILAVLAAGAGYLPLDVKARRERWHHMLGVTSPVAVLTDAQGAQALGDCGIDVIVATGDPMPADGAVADGTAADGTADFGAAGDGAGESSADPGATAYVLFTSGSTGDPKAVAISHRALSTYVAGAVEAYRLGPGDRALHFLPLHFDGHVEEVVVSLCAGATVVVRDEEMTQSLARMVDGWERLRTGVLNLPTSYWHEIVHGLDAGTVRMPGCVRTAIIGGEAAAPQRVRQWFAAVGSGVRLVNTYGPTEATVVATVAELTPDLAGSPVPIGRPLRGMRAVLLDGDGHLAAPGTVGELHLVGDALANGYLGRPELDAERFPALTVLPDRPRAYRTGDLARRDRDGRLYFAGRVDDEFKISGHRVDPGEVEAVLLGCPGVAGAAVVGRVGDSGLRHLAAYVVAEPAAGDEGGGPPTAMQVRAFVRERMPAALVPSVVELVAELPRTSSGKIDRVALRDLSRPHPAGGTSAAGPGDGPGDGLGDGPGDGASDGPGDRLGEGSGDGLAAVVVEVWQEVLGIPGIGPDDDFFDLGGQSLQTIQVANRLTARVGREVTVATVFRHPTVAELAVALAADLDRQPRSGADGPGAVAQMLADSVLPEAIAPPAGSAGTSRSGRVLLTGATGFLGAHLLSALLATTGHRVVCLVRDRDETLARQRLEAALTAQGLPVAALHDRVDVALGDLARPDLGLGAEEFARLAHSCDAIYHNAAVISVMRGYGSLRAVNVHGTRELLRMACVRGIPLHYLSTLNVAPPNTISPVVPEEFLPAHPALRDGYQQSKWAAERLVQQAGERGLPVSVYRLARLVGPAGTGYVNPQDLLWRVLRVGIPIGSIPLLYRADAWTPVDFVAAAVVHLSRTVHACAAPAVFNLVPYPELPLADLCAWINAYGYPVTLDPLSRWRSLLPDDESDIAATAFFDLWSGGDGESDLEIGKVVTDRTDQELAGTGIVCPAPDAALMARYLDHCVREGLLPAPGGAR